MAWMVHRVHSCSRSNALVLFSVFCFVDTRELPHLEGLLVDNLTEFWEAWRRGLVVRTLDLKSGGPGFNSFVLPLDGFVFGGPEFNSSMSCK